MPTESLIAFLDHLRESRLLEPSQLAQLDSGCLGPFASADAQRVDLLRRGWLTPYQLDELLQGRGGGLVLGNCVLLERLGKGGMGEVFKARHRLLDRVVAVKVIRPDHLDQPEAVQRFRREARAAAQLEHPNLVAVHDADQAGDTHFIAMEYVEGTDLGRLVRDAGPLQLDRACDYCRQAALGLQHAHERGLVHRDVKPSNLMLTPAGQIKVLDFGLARFAGAATEDTALTPTDACLGTPDFIAPEQARNSKQADIRSDIFSLGCTLYYLVTGEHAFPGVSRTEKLAARFAGAATPARFFRPQLPEALDPVLARMLARDPAERYQTPAEVAAALAPFADAEELAAPPPTAAADGKLLEIASTLTAVPETVLPPPPPTEPDSRRPQARPRGRLVLALALAAAGVLGLVLVAAGLLGAWTGPAVPTPPDGPPPLVNSVGMRFVPVPAGRFWMGSPDDEEGRAEDEGPRHEVRIGRAFFLGAYEVTQGEYEQVMGTNPSHFSATGAGKEQVAGLDTSRLPVENVTWEEACAFCKRLSALAAEKAAGRNYRLPTEEEWEYACRAGTEGPFAFGPRLSADESNFDGRRPYGGAPPGAARMRTTPVGSFAPNAWGLYDMHGNVWEWCQDQYVSYAEKLQPGGPGDGPRRCRVLRGGGWLYSAAECRSAKRIQFWPDFREQYFGFRVVCEP